DGEDRGATLTKFIPITRKILFSEVVAQLLGVHEPAAAMPILKRLRDPVQPAVTRRKESGNRSGALLLCRQLLTCAGIALAILALVFECYEYLCSGRYLDHIEGNVVISGWQYVHGSPLYETQDGAPRLATYY